MNQTNSTQNQEPISPQTTTIISLSLIITLIIVIITACIYKHCCKKNRDQNQRTRIPGPFNNTNNINRPGIATLSPEQIRNLPPDQQQRLQDYQQSLSLGNQIFVGPTRR
jgi:hypothetical protein